MNTKSNILTFGLLIALFSNLIAIDNFKGSDKNRLFTTSKQIYIDTIPKRNVDQIIFGIFCGECTDTCAKMYRYNINNQNLIYVDYTDSYFLKNGNITFASQITDKNKTDIASEIVKNIPVRLLKTKLLTETYGCPDCEDGCGIYFEITQGLTIKRIYIDYSNNSMPVDIIKFAEYLKTTIHKL